MPIDLNRPWLNFVNMKGLPYTVAETRFIYRQSNTHALNSVMYDFPDCTPPVGHQWSWVARSQLPVVTGPPVSDDMHLGKCPQIRPKDRIFLSNA